jgi:hypothetical protein
MMRRMRRTAMLAAVLAALTLPGGAEAAIDFGSNLHATPTGGVSCEPGCTLWNTSIAPADLLNSVSAPSSGVITKFTLKHSSNGGGYHEPPIHLRVTHLLSPGLWSGLDAGNPDVRLPDTAGTDSFTTRVPINAGDFVGVEAVPETLGGVFAYSGEPGSASSRSVPALPADRSGASATYVPGVEILLQLHLEPDADHDGFGDETQDSCSTSPLSHTVCPPAKKKCKKAKKRAAESKKKKCRKKKRH